jgi:alpha-tubulin suppressor-like RCC1 family protein
MSLYRCWWRRWLAKKVVGASAGNAHTAVRTDANEVFTFGSGFDWQFGHLDEVE